MLSRCRSLARRIRSFVCVFHSAPAICAMPGCSVEPFGTCQQIHRFALAACSSVGPQETAPPTPHASRSSSCTSWAAETTAARRPAAWPPATCCARQWSAQSATGWVHDPHMHPCTTQLAAQHAKANYSVHARVLHPAATVQPTLQASDAASCQGHAPGASLAKPCLTRACSPTCCRRPPAACSAARC